MASLPSQVRDGAEVLSAAGRRRRRRLEGRGHVAQVLPAVGRRDDPDGDGQSQTGAPARRRTRVSRASPPTRLPDLYRSSTGTSTGTSTGISTGICERNDAVQATVQAAEQVPVHFTVR